MYEEKYNIKVDMTFTAINTSDDGRYESVGDGETSLMVKLMVLLQH